MTTLQDLLGSNVRRLRSEQGLTQSELAYAIQRSTDLVSRIERGASAASFETLDNLAMTLGVSVAELFRSPHEARDVTQNRSSELQRLTANMTLDEIAWLTDLLNVARARPASK